MNKTYIAHHGIKGQRWGVRRFQNEDGSLTSTGRKRYDVNEDGTAKIKDKYRKSQNIRGGIKTAIGTTLIAKSALRVAEAKGSKDGFNSKSGKKSLNKAVFNTLLGAVVIGSAVKNFVNANKNKTFNTTGMGGTPETFSGKPKTRAQVIAAQKRSETKK